MQTYTMIIAGVTRHLPIVPISEHTAIASFVMLGDTVLTKATAKALVDQLPEADVLVTAEAKGIPLAQELSSLLNHDQYVVARKTVKPYMSEPLVLTVKSITTDVEQTLVLDERDAQKLKGKRIVLVDDVVSTGESIAALQELVERAGGNVVAKTAVLAEGSANDQQDLIYLEELPLFPIEKKPI
ncbi:phosphoribosyltransferase family protein [Geomicrobium sediminis]|uniref:Adenine phosphoribosyltransferase n=1 Tax=Geomicrobium sediminis TaxID=1347788 RepID=A0ABS2PF25_9BACL|nr:adenine phosphoribosyltransferase [Geomicrobium sediminis]